MLDLYSILLVHLGVMRNLINKKGNIKWIN